MGWSAADARDLYRVSDWGNGFFDVSEEGHVVVRPTRGEDVIDLEVLAGELERRGIQLPILLRFSDLLRERLREIHAAFGAAIDEYGYGARYRGVYPIKVNEQRHVVDPPTDV